ncbi:uncharacterized protein LOC128201270 [Galleria mellonella]|uniref:Uncharacterized protein LOC128201270 n=1 Tax=Galleria mellonella TaxID=7137 RepID=A0ABM3MRA0_GALME|nr:uncharacterized protein LOC128201270 [Galleria mellonella]
MGREKRCKRTKRHDVSTSSESSGNNFRSRLRSFGSTREQRTRRSERRSRSPRRRSPQCQSHETKGNSEQVSSTPVPPVSTSTSGSLELITIFKEVLQNMNYSNNDRFPVINVIPEFDPAKRNQTIDTWILKVNECAAIYNWTERQIIHYALPKLVGLAQKWYQGLPTLLFTWEEWQNKLHLAFPSAENYGQLLTEMLACKARFDESLEEYYYEKMGLLNRCNITGKNAIDCILLGIEDMSIRTSAEAAQFSEPDKLLVFLRNVKVIRKIERNGVPIQSSNFEIKRPKIKYNLSSVESRVNYKCYNCGEDGHSYFKCKQPIKRCDVCRKVGHLASDGCDKKEITPSTNKTVLRIS